MIYGELQLEIAIPEAELITWLVFVAHVTLAAWPKNGFDRVSVAANEAMPLRQRRQHTATYDGIPRSPRGQVHATVRMRGGYATVDNAEITDPNQFERGDGDDDAKSQDDELGFRQYL